MSKSTKITKYFQLYSALKSGKNGVSPEALCETLGFTEGMLAVYIHALRNKFGAVVESVRNGRKVTAYRITNIEEMDKVITANRKPRGPNKNASTKAIKSVTVARTAKTKAPKKSKRVRDDEDSMAPVLDDTSYTEINDSDLADIKAQLGI